MLNIKKLQQMWTASRDILDGKFFLVSNLNNKSAFNSRGNIRLQGPNKSK